MHLSVYEQAEIFYYAFVFGLGVGVWYDFFRLLRNIGFNSKRAFIIQDILFMSGCSVMCFVFSLLTVNGHFRVFVIIGHIFGLLSYRFSVGMVTGLVFKLLGRAAKFLVKIGGRVSNGLCKGLQRISNSERKSHTQCDRLIFHKEV